MLARAIVWSDVLGPTCPVCQRESCYRALSWYWRVVIELFPYREEAVPVARFLCRTTHKTFSLLPHQLAPYFRYTVQSVLAVWVLATARPELTREGVTLELDEPSRVLPFLVRSWRVAVERGLGRLAGIRDAAGHAASTVTLAGLASVWRARGPPATCEMIATVVARYSTQVGMWLMGTPSQLRRRGVPL